MFNKYVFPHGPSNVNVKVTEQRASTDQAISLLYEMQREIEQSVLTRMHFGVSDAKVSCGSILVRYSMTTGASTLSCKFQINGQEHLVEVPFDYCELKYRQKQAAIEAFVQAFCNKVAQVLLPPVLRKLLDNVAVVERRGQ